MWGAVDFDDGERAVVKYGKIDADKVEFGELLHGTFNKIHLLIGELDFAEDFDTAGLGFAGAGFGGAEDLAAQIENAHFLDDVDAALDDVTIEIDAFGDFKVDVATTAGDAFFDDHFARGKFSFPGQPGFGHKIAAELIELAPFVFDVEIFGGLDVVDGIASGIVMEELGGDFFETAVGGEVGRVVEGVTEVDFVKTWESGGEFVVIIIDDVDIWLPKRKGEVGVGGE